MLYNKEWDKPKTPSDILRKAADIMETQGHAKGMVMVTAENKAAGKIGSVCAIGAILVASEQMSPDGDWLSFGMSKLAWEAQDLLETEVRAFTGSSWGHIPNWNNDPNRPGSEVIAIMRAVADKYETVTA